MILQHISVVADNFISTSPDDIKCSYHDEHPEEEYNHCEECENLKVKCKKFQTHSHTFTCTKKSKTITIGPKEGYGKLDGMKSGPEF